MADATHQYVPPPEREPDRGAPMWQRPEAEQVASRADEVREFGVGWVESGFLPVGRYQAVQRDDGWHIYTFDEQQAGWDRDHGLA